MMVSFVWFRSASASLYVHVPPYGILFPLISRTSTSCRRSTLVLHGTSEPCVSVLYVISVAVRGLLESHRLYCRPPSRHGRVIRNCAPDLAATRRYNGRDYRLVLARNKNPCDIRDTNKRHCRRKQICEDSKWPSHTIHLAS